MKASTARLGLLPGYLEDTPTAPDRHRFALICLDSASCPAVKTSFDILCALLSPGRIMPVGDWRLLGCRLALDKLRARHGIKASLTVMVGNNW